MVNLDSIANESNKKWSHISDHPYWILMIGGSKSGKMNTFINLINEQNDIGKIYLYAKGLGEHEILIKQRKNVGIKHFNDSKAFIQCSNTMDDYENTHDYNPKRDK